MSMSAGTPFPLSFGRNETGLRFRSVNAPTVESLYTVRLLCQLRIHVGGYDFPVGDCLIDTGAPISVFPKKTWTQWNTWPYGWVQWLEPVDAVSRQALVVKGVLDTPASARIGRIDVSLRGGGLGPEQPVVDSPEFSILAKFLEVDSQFDRIVLGMAGGALEQWAKLVVDFEDSTAHLLPRR